MTTYGQRPGDFRPGQRVATHPAIDVWMQGDRYGEVVSTGRALVHVRLDSGRTRRFQPCDRAAGIGLALAALGLGAACLAHADGNLTAAEWQYVNELTADGFTDLDGPVHAVNTGLSICTQLIGGQRGAGEDAAAELYAGSVSRQVDR